MNGLPYYKAYPRDFIEGTIGMDFETKAAYRLVLDLIYMQGGALVDDARYIAGLLGCSVKKWNALRGALVSAGKIVVRDGYLGNYRADKEMEILGKFQEKQSKNRRHPNKNNSLESPRIDHTEPDTDTEEKETPIGVPKKRGCRLPDDWEPDEIFARQEGMSASQISREADKFRDYWRGQPGQRGVKLDWQATWRNWVRKAAGDSRPVFSSRTKPVLDDIWAGVDCTEPTEEEKARWRALGVS
jgi:uncharacterized protein YdaU (DUF1376 family)